MSPACESRNSAHTCESRLGGVVHVQENLFCDLPCDKKKQDWTRVLYAGGSDERLTILSMGFGQDSSAIAVLLAEGKLPQYRHPDSRRDVRIVFSDTGVEWPATYEWRDRFSEYLRERGLTVVTLEKGGEFHDIPAVDSWYKGYHGIPTRMSRSCTIRHKVAPIRRFLKKTATGIFGEDLVKRWGKNGTAPHWMLIGIAAEESHRARISDVKYVENHFPLISLGCDRTGCQKIIRKAGLPVPIKSGCVCCPFLPDGWFWALSKAHPDLWERTVELEKTAHETRPHLFLKGKRAIGEIVEVWRSRNPGPTPEEIISGVYRRGW